MERPHDSSTAAQVRAALGGIEFGLAGVLTEARDRGELDPAKDPRELARFLTTSLQGVRVMAKATRDPRLLEDSIAVALRALD
jgi:TetR/AcrR family transcriptional repressor of nem operon